MDTVQEVFEAVRQRRVDEQTIVTAWNIPDEALKGFGFLTANYIRAVGGANPDPARRRDVNDALYNLPPQHRKTQRQIRRCSHDHNPEVCATGGALHRLHGVCCFERWA